jgi:hypothetical protein
MTDTTNVFNSGCNPVTSGLFQVDRGALGKPLRFFNAETGNWSRCEYELAEAIKAKDAPTAIGFLPWKGPYSAETAPVIVSVNAPDVVMTPPAKTEKADGKAERAKAKAEKLAAKAAEKAKAKPVKAPKATTAKVVHPDNSVWYREDRKLWVAMAGGKQEAARSTAEACLAFLKKKYGVDGVVIK